MKQRHIAKERCVVSGHRVSDLASELFIGLSQGAREIVDVLEAATRRDGLQATLDEPRSLLRDRQPGAPPQEAGEDLELIGMHGTTASPRPAGRSTSSPSL